MSVLKRLAGLLPLGVQQELKRQKFRRDIRRGIFRSSEPEFERLGDWVRPGDWVLDIGANVGHYTVALSALVGATGRVLAFEPIPHSFELLAANAATCRHRNVTLLNAAASDAMGVVGMDLPRFESGMQNFYEAKITVNTDAQYKVVALPVDGLGISERITLAKIDAEGHEISVLKGMRKLLSAWQPILIVEGADPAVEALLMDLGYAFEVLPASPNRTYKPR